MIRDIPTTKSFMRYKGARGPFIMIFYYPIDELNKELYFQFRKLSHEYPEVPILRFDWKEFIELYPEEIESYNHVLISERKMMDKIIFPSDFNLIHQIIISVKDKRLEYAKLTNKKIKNGIKKRLKKYRPHSYRFKGTDNSKIYVENDQSEYMFPNSTAVYPTEKYLSRDNLRKSKNIYIHRDKKNEEIKWKSDNIKLSYNQEEKIIPIFKFKDMYTYYHKINFNKLKCNDDIQIKDPKLMNDLNTNDNMSIYSSNLSKFHHKKTYVNKKNHKILTNDDLIKNIDNIRTNEASDKLLKSLNIKRKIAQPIAEYAPKNVKQKSNIESHKHEPENLDQSSKFENNSYTKSFNGKSFVNYQQKFDFPFNEIKEKVNNYSSKIKPFITLHKNECQKYKTHNFNQLKNMKTKQTDSTENNSFSLKNYHGNIQTNKISLKYYINKYDENKLIHPKIQISENSVNNISYNSLMKSNKLDINDTDDNSENEPLDLSMTKRSNCKSPFSTIIQKK